MKAVPSAAPDPGWTRDGLAELLAPALGREQSIELVGAVATRLGFPSSRLSRHDAVTILDALSGQAGLVGVSARFARARLDRHGPLRLPSARALPRPAPPAAAPNVKPARSYRFAEVAGLLENAIGKERSEEILRAEIARANLREPFDTATVMTLLERIGEAGGVVGTVARFAKSRLVLAR